MKIVFATNNTHKLDEIRKISKGQLEILSLSDINCHEDIPETGVTFPENALIKAQFVKEKFGLNHGFYLPVNEKYQNRNRANE